MTRKQALCSALKLFPDLAIDQVNLIQVSKLYGGRALIQHCYTIEAGDLVGEGRTIKEAFKELSNGYTRRS